MNPPPFTIHHSPITREAPPRLFLIAGSGRYPELTARAARAAGVTHLTIAAFENETAPATTALADDLVWLRVGQLGKLTDAARKSGATAAIMAGQIAPKNLFDLRPDVKALLVLAKLKERNAETLFGAVADILAEAGVTLLPATTFLEDSLAPSGHLAGPKLKERELADAAFGLRIAKETSRLDIGQTVVVKNGTVLAVEAFEGTNEAIKRGGSLGRGGTGRPAGGLVIKVTKPNQDFRFDVPVIGEQTLEATAAAGLRGIVAETGGVLFLDLPALRDQATRLKLTLHGASSLDPSH